MAKEILQKLNLESGVHFKLSNEDLNILTQHEFDAQYSQAYKILGDYCCLYLSQQEALQWYLKALKADNDDVKDILRVFPLECDDYQEDPMQYGKMLPGRMMCTNGVYRAMAAVKMGVSFLVQERAQQYPDLDWGNNLFLLACRKKHQDLIEVWEDLTHQKIEYYGILYGYDTAHQNKDEVLKKWFQSHPMFQEEEIQTALYLRHLL